MLDTPNRLPVRPLLCAAGGVLAVFLAGLGCLVWRAMIWQRSYGEAEALVGDVWELAGTMGEFYEQKGREPAGWSDVEELSPGRDWQMLRSRPHAFWTNGPVRFQVRVNAEHGFQVDSGYSPSWWTPATNTSAGSDVAP